jgi:Fur family transcriptional regulator, peroxide stress response regulator
MKEPENSDYVQARVDQMLSKLKDHDFRITPQRLAVLRVLAASEGHPSVEMIYERVKAAFPTTSIATIYKTVSLLRDINEVLELGFADGSNRYDGSRPYPHPHVICTKCKKIIDPDLSSLKDLTKEVAEETGFQILTHRVDFFGICRECQNKMRSSTL